MPQTKLTIEPTTSNYQLQLFSWEINLMLMTKIRYLAQAVGFLTIYGGMTLYQNANDLLVAIGMIRRVIAIRASG